MPESIASYESARRVPVLGVAPTTTAGRTARHHAGSSPSDLGRGNAPLHDGTACAELDGNYLVILEGNVDLSSVRSIAESLGAKIRHEYTACLRGFAGSLSDCAVEALQRLADVTLIANWEPCPAE